MSNVGGDQQQLPYVPLLSIKQVKAIRKQELRHPQVHQNADWDVEFMLQSRRPNANYQKCREAVATSVEKIIHAMAPSDDIKVVDVSLGQYAWDVRDAPLELVIQDMSRPNGFGPKTKDEPLPCYYSPLAIAQALTKAGHNGTYLDPIAQTRTGPAPEDVDWKVPPVITGHPWSDPHYRPYACRFPVMPPILAIHSFDIKTPVYLRPPHPAHMRLQRFIERCCVMVPALAKLISTLCLWSRSHGIPHFMPATLALMAIHWFQLKYGLTVASKRDTGADTQAITHSDTEGFWVKHERMPSPGKTESQFFWVNPCLPQIKTRADQKLGPLLYDFFAFWSARPRQIPGEDIIYVNTGAITRRDAPFKPKANPKCTAEMGDCDDGCDMLDENTLNLNTQPSYWSNQVLIVPDPHLPQHNHANLVTLPTLQLFRHCAAKSKGLLGVAFPLISIFGDLIPQTTEADLFKIDQDCGLLFHQNDYSTIPYLANAPWDLPTTPMLCADIIHSRARTTKRVQEVVQRAFGYEYMVECFGSTRYGVDSPASDLDLVILDPRRTIGFAWHVDLGDLPVIYNIKHLGQVLSKARFTIKRVVPSALVPIVKFQDPDTGLNCDINVNDRLGLFNTLLISRYCDMAPILRPLIITIKRWAKSNGLNNPVGDDGPPTFSSYSLTLMTIGLFQIKGLLPNLQENLEALPEDESAAVGLFWLRSREGARIRCDRRYNKLDNWISPAGDGIKLRDALADWFHYWGYVHQYNDDIMSIRAGRLTQRSQKPPSPTKTTLPKSKVARQQMLFLMDDAALFRLEQELDQTSANQNTKFEDIKKVQSNEGEGVSEETSIGKDSSFNEGEELDNDLGPQEQIEDDGLEDEAAGKDNEPASWADCGLVVVDPFIPTKNVTGRVSNLEIHRFIANCRRCALLLQLGSPIHGVLGKEHTADNAAAREPKQRGSDHHRGQHTIGHGRNVEGEGMRVRGRGRGRGRGAHSANVSTGNEPNANEGGVQGERGQRRGRRGSGQGQRQGRYSTIPSGLAPSTSTRLASALSSSSQVRRDQQASRQTPIPPS